MKSPDGIITYFNKNHPKDLYNYIDIIPSSTNLDDYRNGAYSLINQSYHSNPGELGNNWCSIDEEYSYFALKFPRFYVSPTFYSFESRDRSDKVYPKSWDVEGSIDNKNWVKISEERGENEMQQAEKLTLSFQHSGIFKYIKFTQIETTGQIYNHFCLSSIEIFFFIVYRVPTFCSRNVYSAIPSCFIFLFSPMI